MIKARTRRFVAAGGVLALCVAVLAGGPYESGPQPTVDEVMAICRAAGAEVCVIAFYPARPPRLPSFRELVSVPLPTRLATNGVPGCVRGSARAVVGTTTPTMQATFAAPVDATFELAPLDGSAEPTDGGTQAEAGEPVVWDTGEYGLVPGRTYRWRVRGTPLEASTGWSEWCEFTVAPGLVDLTEAQDVTTVRELRVDPVRRYPVTLTVRQWRLALDGLDPEDGAVAPADGELVTDYQTQALEQERRIEADLRARIAGRAAGRPVTVVLTGNDWACLASGTADWATSWDQMYEEEPEAGNDGPKYWKVLDRISAQLGGPAHPLRER